MCIRDRYYAYRTRYGAGCDYMVARYHDRANACLAAHRDCLTCFFARRVYHADQTYKLQTIFEHFARQLAFARYMIDTLYAQRQYAQRLFAQL